MNKPEPTIDEKIKRAMEHDDPIFALSFLEILDQAAQKHYELFEEGLATPGVVSERIKREAEEEIQKKVSIKPVSGIFATGGLYFKPAGNNESPVGGVVQNKNGTGKLK